METKADSRLLGFRVGGIAAVFRGHTVSVWVMKIFGNRKLNNIVNIINATKLST